MRFTRRFLSVQSILQRPLRGLSVAIALGAALVGTASASAQFGEAAGIAEAMQPEYFSRDVVLFADGLNLDDTQRIILESLFEDYTSEFDAGVAAMHARFEGMKDELQQQSGDKDKILGMVFKPIREWSADRQVLGEQFLENLRLILDARQLEYWPQFEQQLYREKQLHRGRFSGESLNLFYVIRDMKLPQAIIDSLDAELRGYSQALHQALKNRERAMMQTQADMLDSLQSQDTSKSMDAIKKQVKARLAVRDVNDNYIQIITSALPDDLGARFSSEALSDAYPRIYRATPYQRIFDDAYELKGLDDEMRASVREMQMAYLTELSVLNNETLGLLKAYEPEEYLDRAEAFSARLDERAHRQINDPVRPMLQRRKEVGRQYLENLKALIGDEQFAQLPNAERWLRAPREVTNYRPRGLTDKDIQGNPNLAPTVRPGTSNSSSIKDGTGK
ncbi:MAG: hypothetical protein KC983_10105 [Phycisphaerales bacterium]|nr:hypothetical protein [Phycisphaerales bacterium]